MHSLCLIFFQNQVRAFFVSLERISSLECLGVGGGGRFLMTSLHEKKVGGTVREFLEACRWAVVERAAIGA